MIDIHRELMTGEGKRALRFLAVGCGGLAADSGLFLFLHGQELDKPSARAISLLIATAITWHCNRRFTFDRSGQRRHVEFGRYGLVALVAQGFNYGLFLALGALAPTVHPLALIVAAAVAAAGLSYAGQRLFTFAAPAPLAIEGFSRAD